MSGFATLPSQLSYIHFHRPVCGVLVLGGILSLVILFWRCLGEEEACWASHIMLGIVCTKMMYGADGGVVMVGKIT